jgi:MFS family permease
MASADTNSLKRTKTIDFWKFWTGETISNLGSSFTQFALPLLVFKLTGSALNLGIATAAAFLPYLLFGLIIGAWVDRLDRKRMMILVDIGQALGIASIPVMFLLGALNVWWVYGVAFVSTTLKIFFDAGEFAAIPSLIDQDDLVTANGRIQASFFGASILGPLLAGVLLFVMPLPTLMCIDASSFLVSACTLSGTMLSRGCAMCCIIPCCALSR